jgi:hypothetical protein
LALPALDGDVDVVMFIRIVGSWTAGPARQVKSLNADQRSSSYPESWDQVPSVIYLVTAGCVRPTTGNHGWSSSSPFCSPHWRIQA